MRHRIEYWFVMAVRAVVGVMPASGTRAIGAAVGLAFFAIDGRHRRRAVDQLRAAFPTRSEGECRRLARQTFVHFGQLLVTMLRASTQTAAQLLASVDIEGEDRVRAALSALAPVRREVIRHDFGDKRLKRERERERE